MANRLLLADGDAKTLRVLDVSLRAAGFEVRTAATGEAAWSVIEEDAPDVIIADADLPEVDGFELCARVRQRGVRPSIPFIFLGNDNSIAHRIKSIEAGADDYLTKPAYVQEVVARVRSAVQRRDREKLAAGAGSPDAYGGRLSDISVVDLLGIVETSQRSGIVHLRDTRDVPATIYFRQGQVVDAEAGRLSGVNAIVRLFAWVDGSFEVEWKGIRRPNAMGVATADLVLEGMKRLDERNHLAASLGDLRRVFEVNYRVLAERLAEIPDEVNAILRLFDGTRTLAHVVEDSPLPDAEAMVLVTRLRDEGIVHDPSVDTGGGSATPPSEPDKSGASGRITELGLGSGPVQQSFANRASPPSAAVEPPDLPIADEDAEEVISPPNHAKTDPGLGKPMGQSGPGAADWSLEEAPAEGIPEPRREEGNVIRFPMDRRPAESGPVDLAATMPLGRAAEIQRRLTEPLASLTLLPDLPPAAGLVADIAVPVPSDSSHLRTQRGIGPFPSPGDIERLESSRKSSERRADLTASPPAAVPGVGLPAEPLVAAGVARPAAAAGPPPPPPPRVDASPPVVADAGNETIRVSFPDGDISDKDALEELGVPSWRRGARILAAALAAGALAAVLVHRMRGSAPPAAPVAAAAAPQVRPPATVPAAREVEAQPVGGEKARAAAAPPPAPAPAAPDPRAVPSGQPSAAVPSTAAEASPSPAPSPTPAIAAATSKPALQVPAAATQAATTQDLPPATNNERGASRSLDKVANPSLAPMPAGPPTSTTPAADFTHQLADCRNQFLHNRIRDAAAACAAAAASNPKSADALTMLAHVELNRGRLSRANDLAQKSLGLDPNQADAYVIIGGVHQDSGRNDEAKTAYLQYLQLAPQGRYANELRSIVESL